MRSADIPVSSVFGDPDLFPHRLSFDDGLLAFLQTDRQRLRASAFLDGRTDFSTDPARLLSLDALLAAPPPPSASGAVDRFIFHMAFGGSTLISRLLDCPGQAMILREPQCLADIAGYKAGLDRSGAQDARIEPALLLCRTLLRRRWSPDEAIVVKPTNWVNTLLPSLCAVPATMRPLFVTIPRRDFLLAVFRGGPERLAFTARTAIHLSAAGTQNAADVARTLKRNTDQLGILAGLAALAHRTQDTLFRSAIEQGGWGPPQMLELGEIRADPLAAVRHAAATLDLPIDTNMIERQITRWIGRDAKQPEDVYDPDQRSARDRAIEGEHGARIDAAMVWADRLSA